MNERMTLGDKRREFTVAQAILVLHAKNLGCELAGGWWKRIEACGVGSKKSVHYDSLAIDFNLYIDKIWITNSEHPAWKKLHDFWEILGGAPMIKGDANHFSFKHGGRW